MPPPGRLSNPPRLAEPEIWPIGGQGSAPRSRKSARSALRQSRKTTPRGFKPLSGAPAAPGGDGRALKPHANGANPAAGFCRFPGLRPQKAPRMALRQAAERPESGDLSRFWQLLARACAHVIYKIQISYLFIYLFINTRLFIFKCHNLSLFVTICHTLSQSGDFPCSWGCL